MSESIGSKGVRAFARVLGSLDATDTNDAERIDLIRALEELKGAAAAAQARVTVAFDDSRRRVQRDAGVPSAGSARVWLRRSRWRVGSRRTQVPGTSVWRTPWSTSSRRR